MKEVRFNLDSMSVEDLNELIYSLEIERNIKKDKARKRQREAAAFYVEKVREVIEEANEAGFTIVVYDNEREENIYIDKDAPVSIEADYTIVY